MATIKVSIKDKNILELQEDGKKGDIIDLSNLQAADVGFVDKAINNRVRAEMEKELAVTKSKEIEAELLRQEKALNEKHQKQLFEIEVDKNKYNLITQKQQEEIERLKQEREQAVERERQAKELELVSMRAELEKKDSAIRVELERKDGKIAELEERMKSKEKEKTFEIEKTVADMKIEKERLENALSTKHQESKLTESKLREDYEKQLKAKDIEIDLYKNMKLKQSTKMLGETLEKHCDIAFETIRGFLPPSVEYGKDTKATEGSLGDRIYREFDEDGNEVLSIMFEMKNEADATESKKKNEQFLKELDKDRTQKHCEYAVLVTLLEKENEIYDEIYTVPENKYPNMFVIRPQHFTKIIMWLRNVSSKLASSRRELITIQQRDRDYTEFDNRARMVVDKFNKHYLAGVEKHNSAVEEIDKTIKSLTKMREFLLGSDKQLRLASEDLEDLTVKKLAKNNPSILAQIEAPKETATRKKKTGTEN